MKRELNPIANHSLFFSAEDGGRAFGAVLSDVQEYISQGYSALIATGSEESKEQIKRFISKYLLDNRITVAGYSTPQLVDALYTEMAEFSFLTKYIFGNGIEEINVNAWNDIEVQYSNGECVKLDETFESPDHAINVCTQQELPKQFLLCSHVSGMVLDNASPAVLGHLSKNIRIAVMKAPLVDEDVGVACSIRIVNPQSLGKEDFVNGGTATNGMLDFLSECLRGTNRSWCMVYSVCVAGATSSGKTTVAGWLLTTIPNSKRIFTIENGSRELALVRTDEKGKVTTRIVHTLTRYSENEKQNIDQIFLLDMALRFNPDYVVVGEMRGAEANAAQEAARTGTAVLTTIHSNSCEATYRRMVSLCKRAVDMSDETLMGYVTEAYPIIVFCKQLEDKKRRLMEIMECEILPTGERVYRTLFSYNITDNYMKDDKFFISGEHITANPISDSLKRRLLENGMPKAALENMMAGGETA